MSKKYPYKEIVLPNKLRVLLYPMDSVMSVYAVVCVRVGAVYEKQKERGISHFTEHIPFLGTKAFPTPLSLSQAADEIGAKYNGITGRFKTEYLIKLPYTNIDEGIDFLYNFVFEPLNKGKDIEKEKNVILSEYNDFWHNPDKKFNHEFWRKRFKQKEHPYSYRALGIPRTIKAFEKNDILHWREQYYNPANMILSIAGNINEKQLIEKLKTTFGKEEAGTKRKEPKFSSNDYSNFSVFLQNEPRPQIRFFLTFPAFGHKQVSRQKELQLGLLKDILGGSPSSRLYHRLRRKERFVYSAGCNVNIHPWMGAFFVWGSVPAEKLLPTMKSIRQELDKVVKTGVTEEEINLSRKYMAAARLMQFDSPESVAYYFAKQAFDEEEVWFPERYIKEAEKVTKEELNNLAKKIFDYSKTNISLLGSVSGKTLKAVEKIFKV